jgi:DNA-binding IclR family transcriptional regulator
MARKAARALGLIVEEGIAPTELTSKLGMSGGTVRGQLFILSKERLIDNAGGKYIVPNYAVELVKASVQQSTRKEK